MSYTNVSEKSVHPVDPHRYEVNCYKQPSTLIFSALMAILALAGLLIVLTSQGANLGGFNSLSRIGLPGGVFLTFLGGTPLFALFAWMITQEKPAATKKVEFEYDEAHLSTVFNKNKEDYGTIGVTLFQTLKGPEHSIYFKEETTFKDVIHKAGSILDVDHPELMRFIYAGKAIKREVADKKAGTLTLDSPWKDICNHFNIQYGKKDQPGKVYVILKLNSSQEKTTYK